MEDSYSKGDTALKPDLLSYNTVLDSFSKEGDTRSAKQRFDLLGFAASRTVTVFA